MSLFDRFGASARLAVLMNADGAVAGGTADAVAAAVAAPAADAVAAAAPAATVADVAAPAAAVESKPTESAPSLLEAAKAKPLDASPDASAPKPDAGKVADAKPATDAPKDDAAKDAAKPADAPAPADGDALAEKPQARTYEAFKVPDGVTLVDDKVKDFTTILDDGKLSPQERAQKLVDLYVDESKRLSSELAQHQRDVWNGLQTQWINDLRKDPELGGNRIETTLGIAKAVIEEFGGTQEQQAQLLAHTSANGMGNYAGFIRLLSNIGTRLNVIEDGMVPASPGRASTPQTRAARWYGAKGNGAAAP